MLAVRWARMAMLAAACLGAASATAAEPRLTQGEAAPDVTAKMVTGGARTLTLSSLRGKYVLLVIMREGCSASKKDLLTIEAGHRQLASMKFCVFGVVAGASRGDVRDLIKEYDLTFPIGYDRNGEVLGRYGVESTPTSFLIDPKGVILSWSHGTASQIEQVRKLIGPIPNPVLGGRVSAKTRAAWLREAIVYYNAGQLKPAYERCRRLLEVEPMDARAHVLLGDIYRKANKPRMALEEYRRGLRCTDPNDSAKIAAVFHRMANTLMAANKYGNAAMMYEAAIKEIRDADYALEFHAYLGLCCVKLGQRKEALAAFDTFFKLYKQADVAVRRRLARLYNRVLAESQRLAESAGDASDSSPDGSD